MSDTRMRWPQLLQENVRPLFVLNRARRLRFVNEAWTTLTGETDSLGKACLRRGPTESLYRTLAPPKELSTKAVATVRRPAPLHSAGPPWWDITFVKLEAGDGEGCLGIIEVVTPSPGQPPKSSSPFLGSLLKQTAEAYPFDLFTGNSVGSERFLAQLRLASSCTVPVWLHGETGSGRRTAARVIHHNGVRRELPFVRLDCVSLQPYLLEAILFGSGGLAAEDRIGTLVLHHPASLPRDLQRTLSDWLLSSAHPPRVICTSTERASADVERNDLRSEYAASLAVLELAVRPLRERLDELPWIIDRLGGRADVAVFRAHNWPGNLTELRDALAHSALPRYLHEKGLSAPELPVKTRPGLDAILAAVERRLLENALAETGGNATEAAARLGIVRARFARRLETLKGA